MSFNWNWAQGQTTVDCSWPNNRTNEWGFRLSIKITVCEESQWQPSIKTNNSFNRKPQLFHSFANTWCTHTAQLHDDISAYSTHWISYLKTMVNLIIFYNLTQMTSSWSFSTICHEDPCSMRTSVIYTGHTVLLVKIVKSKRLEWIGHTVWIGRQNAWA